jgi:uncharacterized membrane protein YgcG
MATNPPSIVPLVQRPPTRIVASGTLSLAAGASVTIPGGNARQDRIQVIVTNLDTILNLTLQTVNGQDWATVFAALPWTVETTADFVIYNPNGSAVSYQVGELYPDTGNAHGIPRTLAAPGGGGGGTGGTSGGGGTGGTSGGGGTPPGGTQLR